MSCSLLSKRAIPSALSMAFAIESGAMLVASGGCGCALSHDGKALAAHSSTRFLIGRGSARFASSRCGHPLKATLRVRYTSEQVFAKRGIAVPSPTTLRSKSWRCSSSSESRH
jgi:hypothetical protein